MIRVFINNNKIQLKGNMKVLNKIYEDMKVKHPNQFYLRPYMEPGWDGKFKYLSDQGYAKTGLFPMIMDLIDKYEESYEIIDNRDILEFNEIPKKVGDFQVRGYQREAVESIVYNEVSGVDFHRGVIGAATNAGKTIIAAALYKSYPEARCLILMNSKDLYQQFLDDMPKMFDKNWGYMQGKKLKWANVMVCMTPTLINRLEEFSSRLVKYNMVIFDECHLITSKTNKKVITKLYNSDIRVGLSGTPFAHKNPINNMDVKAFFGEQVYTISNIELMDLGYSTPIVVKIIEGNTQIKIKGNYDEEYRQGISLSRERTRKTLGRIDYYVRRNCYPILVVGRFHEHVENLYRSINARFGDKYRIAYVHHKVRNRKEILDKFKKGDIDILVASLIIKLGQNMPLIRCMINAASGDSQINALQLVGRAIRTHGSKKKVYYEDFWDEGHYLKRHSKHRLQYYRHQRFKVIELWKQ